MLTHRVPCPPDRGDRIRAYHLLKAMAGRFDVTLASIVDEPMSDATRGRLARLTTRCLLEPASGMSRRTAAARAMLTGKPITPSVMMSRSLADQLVRLHSAEPFDAVLTYCTGMIGYVRALIDAPAARPFRHVLDLVDVDSLKWSQYAKSSRGPMRLVYGAEARRLRSVEAGRAVPFDAVTVISPAEANRYRQHITDRHEPIVIGNGVDTERFCPALDAPASGPVIIFTGVMSYKPNIDAVVWFARQVMPRILAAVPDARFDIVGKSPADAVRVLGELPGVCVVGPVESTADHLCRASVAVAPMHIAPGVQNKVLEAMACGLPVVCSRPAASGIDATPATHLLVADSEADTAAACVRMLTNAEQCQAIGQAARERVRARYDWSAATAPMLDLLDPASVPAATHL